MAANFNQQDLEEFLQQVLSEMTPETCTVQRVEQQLAKARGPLRRVVQNVLDELIPQEEQERLQKLLPPQPFQPRAPPRRRRAVRKQEPLRLFDPALPATN